MNDEDSHVAQSMATKDQRTEIPPRNLEDKKESKCPDVTPRKKNSSHTLLSKRSNTKDIEGPINSSIFFQHSEKRKLTDDYKIGKTVGQGAYGKVKLVTHRKSGVKRATKHIRKKSVQKDGEQQKLFEEVNILMKLDHPNIVRLFHLYEDKKNYIMVTEYCSGGELFERI